MERDGVGGKDVNKTRDGPVSGGAIKSRCFTGARVDSSGSQAYGLLKHKSAAAGGTVGDARRATHSQKRMLARPRDD